MYVRTARLDLDDYNNDTEDGLHITSMAGTWMSLVKGFGGMRVSDGQLSFNPALPDQWDSYSFRVLANGNILQVNVSKDGTTFENFGEEKVIVVLNGEEIEVLAV
jgi:maltose phosphorylase